MLIHSLWRVGQAFYEDAKQQFDRLAGQVDSVLGRWKELARFYGEVHISVVSELRIAAPKSNGH